MSRLIDADRLRKELNVDKYGEIRTSITKLNITIERSKVDAVEVVRCSQCKWSDWYTTVDGEQYCYCMETGCSGRTADDFCSYGERIME